MINRAHMTSLDFPDGAVVKNPSANAGDARGAGSVTGLGRSPGEGNGSPLQYSCSENPMDSTVHGVAESDTTEQLQLDY